MKLNPLILAFGIIPLTGCGGGGGDDSSNTSTYSVTAIDGYLRNAQVWLDINSNYQLDDEEPSTTTGEGGNAELDVTGIENPEQYSVVVKAIARQTIDEDTITTSNPSGSLTTSSFILSAPAGQQIITPLSTLVDIKMKNGQTQQEALTELSSELNIEETAILNDYLDTEQGAVAAKAKSLILLGVIPDSEENMAALSDGTSNIDEVLTESTLISLQSIEADQLLVNDENQLTTIDIVGTDDVDYDPDANGADKDGDGIINILDAFPNDVSETADSDNDSVGDNEDDFPYNATETVDTDNDGVGDNEDPDANGDGVIDVDEAGFEYASFENKRLYNVYLKEADSGVYYNINTYLFHSSNENLEFGYGYLDENDDYFVDATSWTITDGSLVIPDYGSRYKLIESTNDYFKVCYSGDITNDVLCDDSYASYFFFDKTTAKTFISSNSTTGTNIDLSNMTDSSLSSYFSALEYDVAEQVSTIDLYDIGIDSLSGIEQFELLEKLFAGNNHITDISPLNNFTHLRYLQIQDQFDNDTNDDLNLISYEPILTMPSLTRLNLTEYGDLPPNNAFDLAAMINGLDDKSSMTRLELYGVDLTNEGVSAIIDMPNLERLVISDSATVDDLSSLSMNTWQHLEKLDLSWNNTTSNASSYEEQVAALVEFNLDDMITAGLNLSQLTQLGLSQTTLSDDDLLNIATNVGSNLEVLRLRDINFSNYSNLFDNLNTPNLIRLSIGTYITDQEKKIDFDLSNIDDNLTPGKLERLYLENGNISHFNIIDFTSLKRLKLSDSSISDMSLTEFNSDIQQLTELEDLEIDNLIIDGEVVYCSDLVLYSGTDCEDEEADTVLFTTELISGQTWYTSDFFELVFNEDGTSLMATSLINSEESNEEPLTLTIDSGNLMIGDDQELSIDTESDNVYNTTLTNLDDQTDEKIILYTNLSAFKATLYSGLSDGITIVDSSNDSTNSGYSGFELESVTAIEDGDNLIITVNAAGNILTALNSSAPDNYNNVFWIGINQYFDFGFSKSGEAWLDQDIWENGEYTQGSEVDSNVYEYTILDDTVTLTIPLSIIPSNDYLSIKVEIGIDQFGSADEAEDDAAYDAIYLGIDW